jgi:hypothetical protein
MLIQSNTPNKIQTNTNYTPGNKTIAFTDSIKKQDQNKDLFFGQETAAPAEKKSSKLSLANNLLNASALAAYTVLVGSAVILSMTKRKDIKLAEGITKTSTKLTNQTNGLENVLKVGQTNKKALEDFQLCKTSGEKECKEIKHSHLMKLGEYFGDLKENSDEFTNNLVYGFGTLVVMPLVILFSPFGKKDATKEDRIFTIFRQPISFGTIFAAQLTVEKLVKNLVPELNRFNLIKIKNKDKEGEFFSADINDAKDKFKKSFKENFNLDKQKEIVDKCKAHFDKKLEEVSKFIKEHDIEGKSFSSEEKTELIKKWKEQRTLEKDIEKLAELQKQLAENLSVDPQKAQEIKPADVAGFFTDKATSVNEYNKFNDNIVKNFLEKTELEGLTNEMKEVFTVNRRAGAVKNMTGVLMNSVVSQAIGLIALTFVYGKVMKGYGNYKKSIGDQAVKDYQNKQTSEIGGDK